MTLLCCLEPGRPRLELLRHLILNRVLGASKEFFDDLAALGGRLAQPARRGSHRVAIIAPRPGQDLAAVVSLWSHHPDLDLIVLLPDGSPRPAAKRGPANLTLVSENTSPLLLASYLSSVAALRSGQSSRSPQPRSTAAFSPRL